MGAVTQQDQHGRDGAARDRDGDRTDRDRDRDRAARDRAAADLVAKANKESRVLAWLRPQVHSSANQEPYRMIGVICVGAGLAAVPAMSLLGHRRLSVLWLAALVFVLALVRLQRPDGTWIAARSRPFDVEPARWRVAHSGTVKEATASDTPFLFVCASVTGIVAAEEDVPRAVR